MGSSSLKNERIICLLLFAQYYCLPNIVITMCIITLFKRRLTIEMAANIDYQTLLILTPLKLNADKPLTAPVDEERTDEDMTLSSRL